MVELVVYSHRLCRRHFFRTIDFCVVLAGAGVIVFSLPSNSQAHENTDKAPAVSTQLNSDRVV